MCLHREASWLLLLVVNWLAPGTVTGQEKVSRAVIWQFLALLALDSSGAVHLGLAPSTPSQLVPLGICPPGSHDELLGDVVGKLFEVKVDCGVAGYHGSLQCADVLWAESWA